MTCLAGTRFPNPCPVCGADDDHAERMKDTLEAARGFPVCTVCPHPEQPGHGTGCCCAGLSAEAASHGCCAASAVPPDPAVTRIEDRVAALEAIVAKLAQLEPGFMSEARMDESRVGGTTVWVRITHLPTGVTVEAPTREEAVARLGRAVRRYAERRPEEATGAA